MTSTPARAAAIAVPAPQTTRTRRGPGRPTRNQARQRERELLDAAIALFCENGFEGTTIDAITASVGMAKRTVYARYRDKTALFEAAFEQAAADAAVAPGALAAAEMLDLEETLVAVAALLSTHALDLAGQRLRRLTHAEAARLSEAGLHQARAGTAQTINWLTALFRRRLDVQDGAEDAARAFLHLVVDGPAALAAQGFAVDRAEQDRRMRRAVAMLLGGMAAA